jgi:two-component system chemotaxis sensor kinase CheA
MLDIAGIARKSGLTTDVQNRARLVSDLEVERSNGTDRIEVIVFAGRDGVRKAVPIAAVDRLIEVEAAAIGFAGGSAHVVVNGVILPLLGLSGGLEDEASVDILILSDESCRLAFASAGKVDAAEIDPQSITDADGVRLALVEGQSVELLELAQFALDREPSAAIAGARTCRLPLGDPWAGEFLRPMVEAAGYTVVGDRDSKVDLEVRFEDDRAASKAAAGQVLVISNKPIPARSRKKAIHRDDSEALARALSAASKGKA